jgi:pilus assembly protein Flp/PilA
MVVWQALTDFWRAQERQEGQGLIEYALIILFVALVVIVLLAALGTQLGNTFSEIASSNENASP